MNYNCLYCDQRCKCEYEIQQQWFCNHCKIHYQLGDAHQGLNLIMFTLWNPDQTRYTLTLSWKNKVTSLVWHPKDANQYCKTVMDLHHVIQGVNPTNLQKKIKTLLTFQ